MAEYYFLVSSLPMLYQDDPPPFSTDEFVNLCGNWLPDDELRTLKNVALIPGKPEQHTSPFLNDWYNWEINLRNQLAGTRGTKLGKETDSMTMDEADFFSEIDRGVSDALSQPDPLKREHVLDTLRWKRLEDLESGNIFNFNRLCVYKLKLMLLEKIKDRKREPGEEHLETIINDIYEGFKPKELNP